MSTWAATRPPVPPHVAVWRSVRTHGDTKTERSRRTLALPRMAVDALRAWADSQAEEQLAAGDGWSPRELRTTFVSLMSHQGVAIEEIARLVGHATTRTTEIVYRRELRPVITTGAEIMDQLFTGT
jgi:integrase